ncbi:MAG: NAD(P)H-dependent oxidoreductase subunit E [Bacteroidales bacterium]|nr:NAD(P)H-dependent oxidoreductase subunit E [Bacteroidales bacterium]
MAWVRRPAPTNGEESENGVGQETRTNNIEIMSTEEILKQFPAEHNNMLGILHALQDNNPRNYLNSKDLKAAAAYLNTSLSHVYGVATYYSMFSVRPRGENIIRICNSPVCHVEGSVNIIDELKKELFIGLGETTEDGLFTIELTECLGQCHRAPVMMINENIYGNLSKEKILSILNKYKNNHSG